MSGNEGDRGTEGTAASGLPSDITVISIYPMYSAGQIALATFLGGPLGAGCLLARNYKRLAEPRRARVALLLGVLATAAFVALWFASKQGLTLWLMLAPATGWLARFLQGGAYDRHVAVGGSRGSRWRVVGLGVASLAIYLLAGAGVATVGLFLNRPDRVMIGLNSVFYTADVSPSEARRVGDELVALGPEQKDSGWSVEVTRNDDRPIVAFMVDRATRSDASHWAFYRHLAESLSRTVYRGAPVDVWLIDGLFRPRVKLIWDPWLR
jgi:hypothetical protein